MRLPFLAPEFQIRCSRKQHETLCLEFATFDWLNYSRWAGILRRANLNFFHDLENGKAFGRLTDGFRKPFLAGEPPSERLRMFPGNQEKAATLRRICPRECGESQTSHNGPCITSGLPVREKSLCKPGAHYGSPIVRPSGFLVFCAPLEFRSREGWPGPAHAAGADFGHPAADHIVAPRA